MPQVAENSLSFTPFALSTKDAITSGCLAAQTGAIEHAARLQAQRADEVLCVLSGGAARAIAPHLSVKHQIVDNLVLLGLTCGNDGPHVLSDAMLKLAFWLLLVANAVLFALRMGYLGQSDDVKK